MKSLENGWMVVLVSFFCVAALFVFGSCRANAAQNKAGRFAAVDDGTAITLKADGKDILSYYHAVKDVPAGVNPLYKKSGFIHPLWSPAGKELTRIQAPDHYHHYGIWAPWTLTHIEGRKVDFWNLAEGEGTVRFAGVESIETKGDAAILRVKQEHVDFTADKAGRVSIVEVLEMKARPATVEGRPAWVVDYTSRQTNVLNVPIELDAYRYGGGIGFRATEQWTAKNTAVLTSDGKTRAEADGTRARWCDVNGGFDDGSKAGIVFLDHPSNREHPEPMRVWPLNTNKGRGDMFFEFCPIRLTSWTFEPQKEYVLRYRMIVYDGTVKPETAESLWKEFSQK
ncbi:MAG: PmoA family protein [Planctomycetaceae bacterium]|nr:PmoA family protein [Planctomycetaceae bacterium]